ncbi:hypothetical protein [Pseudoteredinibacter isoporae]|uniref:hypothetical protein n=1 Tax=Pseudoteredinibacter isoporae TaxID=570281 RepID=UPI0031037481
MSRLSFRILLVFSFLLGIASGFVDELIVNEEMDLITQCMANSADMSITEHNAFLFAVVMVGSLAILTAYAGLFFFLRWARYLYLVSFALMPFTIFFGPDVSSGLQGFFTDIANVLSGVILVLIFFSPLKDEFK